MGQPAKLYLVIRRVLLSGDHTSTWYMRRGGTLKPVDAPSLLFFDNPKDNSAAQRILRRLPKLIGKPILLKRTRGLRDRHGAAHAGSFLRQRRILFDCRRDEFSRILVHEVFHFVWLRLGNPCRRSYEELLRRELRAHARGELGWSAEWRKQALSSRDVRNRSRRWREYCCESFCDSAAWLYSGNDSHEEFTLPLRTRWRRRQWFAQVVENRELSI